jgi:D-psicose/D-tagatose/L-ribulose 3-epimerase
MLGDQPAWEAIPAMCHSWSGVEFAPRLCIMRLANLRSHCTTIRQEAEVKFGAHSYIFTDRWADDRLDLLDTVKELGLDCFEIGVGDDVSFSPELTRRRAEALGLEVFIGPGGAWPIECDVSSDSPADRKRGLAWHKKQVDLANRLGATAYCGALYGHPGVVKRRRPAANELEHTAECLHHLAEHGQRKGVKIALEPMSHFRTHVANTPEQVMALISKADHPNLFVVLDTYHLVTEVRDYAQAIQTVRQSLLVIHACENDRGVPGGGLVPWDTVFQTLNEIDFQGYVLFESYNSSIGDFAFQRGMFHNVCPDGIAFVREALAFVQKGLELHRQKTKQGG